MKRLISAILTVAMMLSLCVSLIGCRARIDSGTEAAKLLLANERLDSKVLSKIDLGIDGTRVASTEALTPIYASRDSEFVHVSDRFGVNYTWTEFEKYSHSMVEFTQFMKGIENQVERVATEIDRMKRRVGVTDKWVDGGFLQEEEHMLRVCENMDTLYIKMFRHNALYVCNRYTNENAKNVYEIFSFYQYEDGDTARMQLTYIPGERYEWFSQHANGFSDYFIAENSRGYWVATRFDVRDQGAVFWPLMIKDGLGYGATIDIPRPEFADDRLVGHVNTAEGLRLGPVSVFDPKANRELFRLVNGGNYGSVNLYFTGIKNGFVSVSSSEAIEDVEDGVYIASSLDKLVTSNGEHTAVKDYSSKGEFAFTSGYVQHYYGDDFDYGSIEFTVNYEDNQKSLIDYIEAFGPHIDTYGLELYCDMDTVKRSYFHANEFANNFHESFEWNGYKMSSFENAEKARQAFYDAAQAALDSFNEVKDFPKAENRQKLARNADFAEIAAIVMGENTYSNGKINVPNVQLTIADTALFEIGLDYTVKLGLALCDEDGNPISVNTVVINSENGSMVKYQGGEITLSIGGEYQMPKNLSQGEYALVAYASTADGIRVSEMEKLAFVSISEGKLDSTAMDIEITNVESTLHATYTIKNERTVFVNAEKETYTYQEVRRLIMQEILAYGYPDAEATLCYGDGTEVERGAELGKGRYRMTAYLNTSDGIAQSYVYLVIE